MQIGIDFDLGPRHFGSGYEPTANTGGDGNRKPLDRDKRTAVEVAALSP
jgi:hypothetical protein